MKGILKADFRRVKYPVQSERTGSDWQAAHPIKNETPAIFAPCRERIKDGVPNRLSKM
jgi:hypothetical protein